MNETQKSMLALSMLPELFKTSTDDAINLRRFSVHECEQFASLRHVASTYDYENRRIVDSCYPSGPRFITFAPVLKFNTFPLAQIVSQLLDIAAKEMKTPVEIEFAASMPNPDSDRAEDAAVFNVLQIRPISADSLNAQVDWDTIDQSDPFIMSDSALGVGAVQGVRDVFYLKQAAFDKMQTRKMADTVREWNAHMREQHRHYVLIGFGRWGSAIPTLGVPVQWSDISEAKAIVECSLEHFRIDPSQGSHFFQNLTSFNVGYVNVDPFSRASDFYDEQQLNALPAEQETEFVRHVRLPADLQITIDGFSSHACLKISCC